MDNERLISTIKQIQAGDALAFDSLVSGFQDLAVGIAFSWLHDPELARDVAQEAFIDAYRHIGQLNDPAAFPDGSGKS